MTTEQSSHTHQPELRITRYRQSRYWAVWNAENLVAVTLYKKGARAISQLINPMKTTDNKKGLLVHAVNSDGTKVRIMVNPRSKKTTLISYGLKGEFAADMQYDEPLPALLESGAFTLTSQKAQKQVNRLFAAKVKKAKTQRVKAEEKTEIDQLDSQTLDRVNAMLEALEYVRETDEAFEANRDAESVLTHHQMVLMPGETRPIRIPEDIKLCPGTQILRRYKGNLITVTMLAPREYFYDGRIYPTLTHISWLVSGYQISGNAFFGLPIKHR